MSPRVAAQVAAARASVSRKPGEIARPRAAQRDARRRCARRRPCCASSATSARARADPSRAARRWRRAARAAFACDAQRMREPVPQQPAARRGGAAVEQREQRRRGVAAQRRGDLEVAARRGIEREEFARGLDGERAHVRERRLAACAGVAEQRAGGADRQRRVVDAERREVVRAELLRQRARRGRGVELPRRQACAPAACRRAARARDASSGTSSSAASRRSSAPAASASALRSA